MRFWRKKPRHADRPDIEKAKADLERVRDQRPEVQALVESLRRERQLNNFTANVVVTFQGGRR
jgi:hypothetical protein